MKNWNLYQSLLKDLEGGNYEPVSKVLHEWRKQLSDKFDVEKEWLRKLLATRIAIKQDSKNLNADLFNGEFKNLADTIKSEIYFVRGLARYEQGDFEQGIKDFAQARVLYGQLKMHYRELLSEYNYITGSECAGQMNGMDEVAALNSLAFKAHQYASQDDRCKKFFAMAERQKSFVCQKQGNLSAAFDAIQKALPSFEIIGPLSDLQICQLQLADILLDLAKLEEAKVAAQHVSGPIDTRVRFPKAFIDWRLKLGPEPKLKEFVVVPNWRFKYDKITNPKNLPTEKISKISWSSDSGNLAVDSQLYQIKVDSLEGRLVSVLHSGQKSKELLCTSLWPENSDSLLVENRLHRLISRLNKKIPKLVNLKSGRYTLGD
jgi:tetratricopeptide (TPR) repeat protein